MWKTNKLVLLVVSLMLGVQMVSSRRTVESMSMGRDGNLRMEEKVINEGGLGSSLSISMDEILEDIERVVVGEL
jgi:hypothetical protein